MSDTLAAAATMPLDMCHDRRQCTHAPSLCRRGRSHFQVRQRIRSIALGNQVLCHHQKRFPTANRAGHCRILPLTTNAQALRSHQLEAMCIRRARFRQDCSTVGTTPCRRHASIDGLVSLQSLFNFPFIFLQSCQLHHSPEHVHDHQQANSAKHCTGDRYEVDNRVTVHRLAPPPHA